MLEMKEWDGFEGRLWKEEINVRQFIQDTKLFVRLFPMVQRY